MYVHNDLLSQYNFLDSHDISVYICHPAVVPYYVIRQTRSHREGTGGPLDVIKYYLSIENIIEILAILNAGMLGLGNDGAKKIKRALTTIYNQSTQKPPSGPFYSLDMQKQILEAIRDIAQSYTGLQKEVVNWWWSTVAESSVSYYPWLYPTSFTNMASKAYRSMADYAILGLNMAQNNFDAYIDMSKIYSGLIADNINEMSEMAINSSRMFESHSRAPILSASSSRGIPLTRLADMDDVGYDDVSNLLEWIKLRDDLAKIVYIALNSA